MCLVSHHILEIVSGVSPSCPLPIMLTAHILGQVFMLPIFLAIASLHYSQRDLSKMHTLHIV